ncbi:MAG: alpha/beta hydrolase [Pseudomonadota bacterium]
MAVLALAAGSSAFPAAAQGRGEAREGTFSPTPCWFHTPRPHSATCGHLLAPERHGDAASRLLHLPVAIFTAGTALPLPPLLFIDGGPGSDGSLGNAHAGRTWADLMADAPFLRGRRVIVMAQRGTADETSRHMACSTLGSPLLRAGISSNGAREPDIATQARQALAACREEALAAGYDLITYSTENAARDLGLLRRALGLERWDILGVSYGARVGLTLMAHDPDGVRAAVFDGPDLPGSYAAFAVADRLKALLAQLQADCLRHGRCGKSFPTIASNLRTTLMNVAKKSPRVGFRVGDKEAIQFITLTPKRVLSILTSSFYTESALALLPRALHRASRRDFSVLAALGGALFLDPFLTDRAYGMTLSVDCQDFAAQRIATVLDSQAARDPLFAPLVEDMRENFIDTCAAWLGAPRPSLAPAHDTVFPQPILFISGVYDPVTPLSAVEETAARFPNSHRITVAALGHSVLFRDACPDEIAAAFFQKPEAAPDSACLARMPQTPDFDTTRNPAPRRPFVHVTTEASRK